MQNSANPISSSLSGAFLESSGHLWPASSRLSAGEQVTIASDDEFESAIALQQLKTSTNQSLQNSACTQLSEPNTLVSTPKKQPRKINQKMLQVGNEILDLSKSPPDKPDSPFENTRSRSKQMQPKTSSVQKSNNASPSKNCSTSLLDLTSSPNNQLASSKYRQPSEHSPNTRSRSKQVHPQENITSLDTSETLSSENSNGNHVEQDLTITELYLSQRFQTQNLHKVRDALKIFTRTVRSFEVGTSKKTDLSDSIKGRRLVMRCSLGGQSLKQIAVAKTQTQSVTCGKKYQGKLSKPDWNNTMQYVVPRKSSSLKVDCAWEVTVKFDPLAGDCYVKKLVDEHTNGCNPSPVQHAAVRARTGQTYLNIPLALAVTLRVLFQSRTKPSAIRDLLREHKSVPDTEPIFAQSLINLKLKLFNLGKDLDKWESTNFAAELDTKTMGTEDRKTLARFAREWVKDHLNEDNGANILTFLKDLKEKYPGFEYRYARDQNKCLTAWMFMTAEMQYFAKLYGQVLFLDWMKCGVSDVEWPYQGAVVLDEDLHVHLITHTVACTESNDSYKFGLNSMTSIVPELHEITKVTFSDRLASESVFF